MLHDLHIENIAVIEKVDITFSPGLNVLTGETGAGKSIIIDALQSVLGARTNRELVRAGAEKAVVAAVFETRLADDWLKGNDIDADDELILQRRIAEDGKSSIRVNGVPMTAAQLKELSSLLLDIHGQNDGRQLLDETRHRQYLDAFGDYAAELDAFSAAYDEYRSTQKEIARLTMDENERQRLSDNLRTMAAELDEAQLREGEQAELSARRDLLHNAEKLTESVSAAYEMLYGGDESAVNLTDAAASETERAARFAGELETVKKTISEAGFLLRDAAETLNDFLRSLDFSADEYDRLETRLALLRRLEKKYGGDEAQLIQKLESAREQLDELEYSDEKRVKLEKKLAQQKIVVQLAAKKLTDAREKAANELQKQVESELSVLSMPSVRFLVDIIPIDNEDGFNGSGGEEIRFLMSANKGEKPGPISKIASGGEMSRIMLAMKNVFSQRDTVETLVFDEIDTGVSGIAAQRVGEKLVQLSRGKQVLCVTHLPQIAAMADTHFLIEKSEKGERTFTQVTALDHKGRARELARLHGGENISETTLKSAEEQLETAERFRRSLIKK